LMMKIFSTTFFCRSISCFFILCFHVFWFSFYATSNPGVLFHLTEKVRYQWIANAALMVDSFFAIRFVVLISQIFNFNTKFFSIISGFLVAYNFLRSEKQMGEIKDNSLVQNTKLFMKLLLHRVIRWAQKKKRNFASLLSSNYERVYTCELILNLHNIRASSLFCISINNFLEYENWKMFALAIFQQSIQGLLSL
jgi:hypothetical protein